MPQSFAHIAHLALIVRDYDEAIAWFTERLGFTLVADEHQPGENKRWVLVAAPGAGDNAPYSSPAPPRHAPKGRFSSFTMLLTGRSHRSLHER